MKNNKEIVDKRREEMLSYIQRSESINVNDLMVRFDVSAATVRRDLKYLETKNYIFRSYGKAMLNPSQQVGQKALTATRINRALAEYAASFIEDNDTIFTNTSSTACMIMQYIHRKNVTLVTNNANAVNMEHDPCVQVILAGGELRLPKYSLTGDFTIQVINQVHADKCFLGCNGISSTGDVTTAIYPEASVNRAMAECCHGPVFILANHTKVGKTSNFFSFPLSDVRYLITDTGSNEQELSEISKSGITIFKLPENINS